MCEHTDVSLGSTLPEWTQQRLALSGEMVKAGRLEEKGRAVKEKWRLLIV